MSLRLKKGLSVSVTLHTDRTKPSNPTGPWRKRTRDETPAWFRVSGLGFRALHP